MARRPKEVEIAKAWLEGFLDTGRPADEIRAAAAQKGISRRTLQRARLLIGIQDVRYWVLPGQQNARLRSPVSPTLPVKSRFFDFWTDKDYEQASDQEFQTRYNVLIEDVAEAERYHGTKTHDEDDEETGDLVDNSEQIADLQKEIKRVNEFLKRRGTSSTEF